MTDYVWHDENYDKRRQLTIDSGKVDEDLTDFPVLIHLSDSSGITSVDVTSVFDELTSVSGVTYDNIWNPHDKAAGITLSNGNLTATRAGSSWNAVRSVESRSSGKWYWEVKIDVANDANNMVGIGTSSETLTYPGKTAEGYGYYGGNGQKYTSGAGIAYGSTYTANDVIGTALDLDNGKIWWSKNGVWQASGVPASGTNPAYTGVVGTFFAMTAMNVTGSKHTANFGAFSFTYTPPTGFKSGFTDTVIPNNKKIAVYTTSGTQDVQCYTEIENWITVSGSEEAWMWIKVPTVSSGTNTQVYLYYDKDVSDNTSYVGDVGDYTAKQVWDSNFNAVFHFSEDNYYGTASEIKNSTGGEHGHALNSAKPSSALIGDGLDVDTTSKGALLETNINPGNVYTAEYFFLKPWGTAAVNTVFRSASSEYFVLIDSDNLLAVYSSGWYKSSYNISTVSNGWHNLTAVSDDTNTYFYVDGNYVDSVARHCTTGFDYFGGFPTQPWGDVDEVRVSNVVRSLAWIKATYNTGMDTLITFGSEELKPSFIFNGYVQVQGTPAERTVYLYHRSTGSLVGTAVSNGSTGYFEIPTPFNDYHFVNILPELAEGYNILVEDKIERGS